MYFLDKERALEGSGRYQWHPLGVTLPTVLKFGNDAMNAGGAAKPNPASTTLG